MESNVNRQIIPDDPLPYYAQLKNLLMRKIESGEWKPHDKLPSEAELCEQYGVSRTVVRQSLLNLFQEGMIYHRKGKGSFVAEPKLTEGLFQNLIGFHEEMTARGVQLVTKVLENTVIPADDFLMSKLGLNYGDKIIKMKRLRFVAENPIVLSTSYVPYRCCPELIQCDLSSQSFYKTLENDFGLQISHGRRTIEAIEASAKEAKLLNIQPGKPLLMVESQSFLKDGTVFEFSISKHRADRSRFEAHLIRTNKQIETLFRDGFPQNE
jgi:GntR family transcriptional regulator